MKTATFSTGYTDTYKGTRAVTAAWAIIRKADGAVLASGHSLDRAKAAKTAEGNSRYHISDVLGRAPRGISFRPGSPGHNPAYYARYAPTIGFKNWKEAYAAYQADAAAARDLITIEIVDI